MKKVTCDACSAPIGPVGFEVTWAGTDDQHESVDGHRIVGDYCSAQCILRALNALGTKAPDFDVARLVAAKHAPLTRNHSFAAADATRALREDGRAS
jgi:hypothetical protein